MNMKSPALLVVLLEPEKLRWSVAGIKETAELVPLVQSESGDLAAYIGLPFDEQTTYLRHRLAGAVQRGCDRLWGRNLKASLFVFVQIGEFQEAPTELSQRVADHFCEWMVNPPAAFCQVHALPEHELTQLAGELSPAQFETVQSLLPTLTTCAQSADAWEIVPSRNRC